MLGASALLPESVKIASLRQRVSDDARRWKRLAVLEAFGGFLAFGLCYSLIALAVDLLLPLPVVLRFLAGFGFLIGLVVLAVRQVRRISHILRLNEDEVALAIERSTPGGLQNRLINALQLTRLPMSATDVLAQAVVRENCDNLGRANLAAASPSRPALTRFALASAAILLAVGLWLWQPERFSQSANRFLRPLATTEAISQTRLVVDPHATQVEAGADLTIRIRIEGVRPETLTLTTESQGRSETVVLPVSSGEETVEHTFANIRRTFNYRIQGNDFTTIPAIIQVPTPAALALLRATLNYPAYTRLPAKHLEQAGGNLEALQGTTARVQFVFDQPIEAANLVLQRVGSATDKVPDRIALEMVSPTEFAGQIVFDALAGYYLETRKPSRQLERGPTYSLRILHDQDPKLELVGLNRQTEGEPEATIPLRISASDDFGLRQVGLFARLTGTAEAMPWQSIVLWPTEERSEFRLDYPFHLAELKAGEGERWEVALRASDTDPRKEGQWATGSIHTMVIGGEGAALQRQYEQILKTEAQLKQILNEQRAAITKSAEWVRKMEGDDDLRWDEPRNLDRLHSALKPLALAQQKLRESTGVVAREMVLPAGDLRLAVAMLADTEMVRARQALEAVPGRDSPEAKRLGLVEARSAQERTARSLEEMIEAYVNFRRGWELAQMIPFTRMLADRQKKLADLSTKLAQAETTADRDPESMQRRQRKILELTGVMRPAYEGIAERLAATEPVVAKAFAEGVVVLGSEPLRKPMSEAITLAGTGAWAETAIRQTAAAQQLDKLHAKLNLARSESARQLLQELREKAKTDAQAQKAIEALKPGTAESGVKDDLDKVKIEDLIRLREIAQAKKQGATGDAGKAPPKGDGFDDIDRSKLELLKDSGVRQDPNILSLGNNPEKSQNLPNAVDTERNKVKPFVQEKFDDLVGKLLEEADEVQKDFQTLTLSTNQNNSDPGEIMKQGGRINSTGAVAATGNKKPPSINVGGVSRSGRSGARAYGSVLGDEAVSRRGRDQAQEGEQRIPDQAGSIKETKGDDPYTDTSTGAGGKKVESEHTNFSVKDVGKWTPDMLKGMDKPQKKFSIVERQGDKLDPKLAALLRDSTGKQEQIIERLKAIKKDLRTLYLPTDAIDEAQRALSTNLERLKERPDAELFRMQMETLDRLRGAVKVFRGAGSSLQPSLPREREIKGRVWDDPSRPVLPGYEGAVKRYYERLADQ